jgi:hypothetical protein
MQVLLATLNGKKRVKISIRIKKYSTKIIFDHLITDSSAPKYPNHASPACHRIAKATFYDPGPFLPLNPGSGMGKKQDPDPG